jgi:hypothetical protein
MISGMPRPACRIKLDIRQRSCLESLLRQPKAQARFAERVRMILWADDGLSNAEIARRLHTRRARVSKWRTGFGAEGMEGLWDDFRPGRPAVHDLQENQKRILQALDQTPPSGLCQMERPIAGQGFSPDISQFPVKYPPAGPLIPKEWAGLPRSLWEPHSVTNCSIIRVRSTRGRVHLLRRR